MKKYLMALLCIFVCTLGHAKNTYVPFYKTQVSLTQDGKTTSIEGTSKEVSIGTLGDKVVFTILHEEVTPSKVKSIKRAKANIGWTAFMAGLIEGPGSTEALSSQSMIESAQIHSDMTKKLKMEMLIENNTDEDLFLCDIKRSMEYFHIPAHSFLTITLANPEVKQFRVSNAYPFDHVEHPTGWKQEVAYLSVYAKSHVEKMTIEYEDDECIVFENGENSYIYLKKETFENKPIDLYEYRKLKKSK